MESEVACIMCGRQIQSTVEDPRGDDRHEALVCGAHSDQDLHELGLDDLWAGIPARHSKSLPGYEASTVSGVWEQGPEGCFGIYIAMRNGDLLIIMPVWAGAVSVARVRRNQRALDRPLGLASHTATPWSRAVAEAWTLRSIAATADDHVEVCFDDRGVVVFSSCCCSWRELGDGRHFLEQEWRPGSR